MCMCVCVCAPACVLRGKANTWSISLRASLPATGASLTLKETVTNAGVQTLPSHRVRHTPTHTLTESGARPHTLTDAGARPHTLKYHTRQHTCTDTHTHTHTHTHKHKSTIYRNTNAHTAKHTHTHTLPDTATYAPGESQVRRRGTKAEEVRCAAYFKGKG